jgi:putative ABC transport system permease protein
MPVLFDFIDALRGFRRDRGYAVAVIATLALTTGATTAVFSIVNGVLLKPLPYPQPDRLVAVREIWRELGDRAQSFAVNERHFEYLREHSSSFESLAQYRVMPANLTVSGEASQVVMARASGSVFDLLGAQPALGRTLAPSDEPENAPDVVTITDALWRRRLNADPAIVGRPIVLDGRPYTVVGILRPEFRLPVDGQLTADVDAFVPLRIDVGWIGDHNNQAIGRLRHDTTLERAHAELDVLQSQVSAIATKEANEPVTLASAVFPLDEYTVGASRRGLLLLLAAIGAVLLIACSNLASLSLSRALGKLRDAAIRTALGASRRRLIMRTVFEHIVLAIAGGLLGLWVASVALALFVRTAPVALPRVEEVALDGRVLAFAAGVSIAAGLLVALLPAVRLARRDVQSVLRAAATNVTSDRGTLLRHGALLAVQVALSVTLLVVTALFGVSLKRVLTVDRGFTADRVLAIDIALPAARYAAEPVRRAAYDRLLASIREIPGVESVSTTSMLPLSGRGQVNFMATEGRELRASELPSANFRFVAPEFFKTLGIAIRQGRPFTDAERDPDRPAPALISEPTAARLWPGENPLGKRFSRGIPSEQGFEVVGVVADARLTALDQTPPLMVYLPYWWRSRATASLLIKTGVDPAALLPDVRRATRAVDPEIALGAVRPVGTLVDAAVATRKYQTQLFIAFGLVALFIATLGVYAVTSYGISRRRREMNIRVALGARASQVIRMLLWQGMTPVAVGAVLGALGAVASAGLVASLLFDVQPRDPLIVAAVIAIVSASGLITCAVAAQRGISIDPAAALRDE